MIGTPPDWMPDEGKTLWAQMVDELHDSLEPLDVSALTLTCAHYASAVIAAKDLCERGPLIEGDRGWVKNPSNQVAREQSAAFRAFIGEFGLTPGARKRLAMKLNDGEDKDGIID